MIYQESSDYRFTSIDYSNSKFQLADMIFMHLGTRLVGFGHEHDLRTTKNQGFLASVVWSLELLHRLLDRSNDLMQSILSSISKLIKR